MSDYDVIVIGAGSGDMVFTAELTSQRCAIVESDKFGGTCLNRGCIPSKMYVVTADIARAVAKAERFGVHASLDGVDWPAVRDRIFGRIDPLPELALALRQSRGVDVVTGHATFVSPHEIEVDGRRLTADQFVIATGSRPVLPPIPGLAGVEHHTSDTIMRLAELPRSMVIIGGGYIAAEFGHVFDAFGTEVTIVSRNPRLLPSEDDAVSQRFTSLAADRFALHLGAEASSVRSTADGVEVTITAAHGQAIVTADVLLIATGREPQTDEIGVAAAGLDLDEHGHVRTDRQFRTTVPGIWAFGDAENHFQLKHMANAEMRVVAHNLTHPDDLRELPDRPVPHAVFTDPQIASIGMTEAQARAAGVDLIIAVRDYSKTAYGWALEDTTSFVKVLADRRTRRLVGAHILGPNAALLLQPLVQGMILDTTVDQLARDVIYLHPSLAEVVEQALLDL